MAPNSLIFGILQAATLVVALILVYRPFGNYLAWVFVSRRDWVVERGIYRLIGVDPRADQSWPAYARGVIAFSLVGVLIVYGLQRMPVTLYVEQWDRLLNFSDELRTFMKENDDKLKRKER